MKKFKKIALFGGIAFLINTVGKVEIKRQQAVVRAVEAETLLQSLIRHTPKENLEEWTAERIRAVQAEAQTT